jgi:hypothetical protein
MRSGEAKALKPEGRLLARLPIVVLGHHMLVGVHEDLFFGGTPLRSKSPNVIPSAASRSSRETKPSASAITADGRVGAPACSGAGAASGFGG